MSKIPLPFLRPRGLEADAPRPATAFHAVGDPHGRLDLLAPLLRRIARRDTGPIVVLGDMVDRGPDSAGVLRMLHRWRHEGVVCLRGNHEEMLLDFLRDPGGRGGRWLRHGGRQTLESFGLAPPDAEDPEAATLCARALAAAMGELVPWIAGLPRLWRSGAVVAVHAGLDPARPPEAQEPRVLAWGHPRFATHRRRDGIWVVHGHVIRDSPEAGAGRIAVDTGAWATGRLSAAHVAPGGVAFLTEA